jgi:uncharacterized membrane protein YccC
VKLERVRPDLKGGVRAGFATMVPLIAAEVFHLPELSWVGLAAFSVSLADKGGMYRTRAAVMMAASLADAVWMGVAAMVGVNPTLAVAVALVVAFAGAMARVYGPLAGSIGTSVTVNFAISLAVPVHDPLDALARSGLILAGGIWTMAVALILWPLRPYRPARLAVARCYRAIAVYAGDIARAAEAGDAEALSLGGRDFAEVRNTLEEARSALAVMRRGRPGAGLRGERLLILLESADQLLGALVGIADVLESLTMEPALSGEYTAVTRSVRGVADTARAVAEAVVAETNAPPVPEIRWGPESIEAPRAAILRLHYALLLLGTMRGYATTASEMAQGLNTGRVATRALAAEPPAEVRRSLVEPIRANLSRSSLLFRHALRVCVATGLAVWLTYALGIQRGYWVTLTVLIVLQPYTGATVVKGMQRVLGTVLGGLLTAAIPAVIHDPRAMLVLIPVLAITTVAVLPLNYGLYAVFLTPTFVLLAEVGERDWGLARVRIVDTILGAGIALAGIWLLRAIPERRRFPDHVADAIAALREYLAAVVGVLGGEPPATPVAALRRNTGLQIIYGETSLQRLTTEIPRGSRTLESGMSMIIYLKRTASTLNVLAAEPPLEGAQREYVLAFRETATRALEDLERALRESRPPAALVGLGPPPEPVSPSTRDQLGRVARAIRVIHAAVTRYGAVMDEEKPRARWARGGDVAAASS